MPLTHTTSFRVRHYECDLQGFVQAPNYLRYLQEVAFEASAAAGYTEQRYLAMGCYWLVRETQVEVHRPLRYGDPVQVATWVVDFRRVRSRRAYQLRNAMSGELMVAAFTDWAFLDLASGRPAPIPRHLIDAFFPEGAPETALPRERFPAAPQPAGGPFVVDRVVEWRDLDPAGHVNNAVYLAYAESAGWRALAARGWPVARLARAGITLIGHHHRIEYRQPALPDDRLEVALWFTGATDQAINRHATVIRKADGALLARDNTRWHCLARDTGRRHPWPEGFVADLGPLTARA